MLLMMGNAGYISSSVRVQGLGCFKVWVLPVTHVLLGSQLLLAAFGFLNVLGLEEQGSPESPRALN